MDETCLMAGVGICFVSRCSRIFAIYTNMLRAFSRRLCAYTRVYLKPPSGPCMPWGERVRSPRRNHAVSAHDRSCARGAGGFRTDLLNGSRAVIPNSFDTSEYTREGRIFSLLKPVAFQLSSIAAFSFEPTVQQQYFKYLSSDLSQRITGATTTCLIFTQDASRNQIFGVPKGGVLQRLRDNCPFG